MNSTLVLLCCLSQWMCRSWATSNEWTLPTHWEMIVLLSILVLWWRLIVWDLGQLPLICTQKKTQKLVRIGRVGHWRQSWLQQVVFRSASIWTILRFWKWMEMVVFPREQYSSSYHECPLLLLKFSSLPSPCCSKSLPSFCVVSLHSSLLSCIVTVVHDVTINKNCESKLPAMMRQQID